jgi:hypothetical protein
MGQQNDSINAKISPKLHTAINDTVMDLLAIFEAIGVDTTTEIDFDPGTGEPLMTAKTKQAIEKVLKQMAEKNITVDKVMMSEKPETSGYYVVQGRVVKNGVILAEGEAVGFVPLTKVQGLIRVGDKEETAIGVLV